MKGTVTIALVFLVHFAKCQIDSIPNRNTFDPSLPISTELTTYLNKPADLITVPQGSNTILWNCAKTVNKKSYWYQDKGRSIYTRNFNCTKDKSSIMTANIRKANELNREDKIIELSSSVKEPTLGKNDFIAQNIKDVVKRFGPTYIKKNNCLVYHNYTDKILVLVCVGNRVTFYRYVWLNKAVSSFADIEPEILKAK